MSYLIFEKTTTRGKASRVYLATPVVAAYSWSGRDAAQTFPTRKVTEDAARELDATIRRRGYLPGSICIAPTSGGEAIVITKGSPRTATLARLDRFARARAAGILSDPERRASFARALQADRALERSSA